LPFPFDRLIVATGAASASFEPSGRVLGLEDFRLGLAQTRIRALCERDQPPLEIAVIGGGATGVQFLFELADYLRRHARGGWRLRHIHGESRLLARFPARFHDYASARMDRAGVERYGGVAFLGQEGKTLILSRRDGGGEFRLPSDLSLLFTGVKPNPFPIDADHLRRVKVEGETLERIFAAGDCARFQGLGANALSAQVAAQKGRIAALNALGRMRPYEYAERGYFVSLGPRDCIGWLGDPGNVVAGLPALALKKAIEARNDPLSL
jgi:NADH dehydrogenase